MYVSCHVPWAPDRLTMPLLLLYCFSMDFCTSGTLAGLSGVALWITTANWIRRKFFQVGGCATRVYMRHVCAVRCA
jgi:hypothetical protein